MALVTDHLVENTPRIADYLSLARISGGFLVLSLAQAVSPRAGRSGPCPGGF